MSVADSGGSRGTDTGRPPLLLIEDTPSLRLVYEQVLRNAGHTVTSEMTGAGGRAAFRRLRPPVVLLDLMLPDCDGLDLMQAMLAEAPETRVIVITANGSINKAVAAMRAGAHEFLVKPFDEQRFVDAVRNALAASAPAAPAAPPPRHSAFIGDSRPMQEVYARIASVARSMATVFITGESGTGKELCAQAVHDQSGRAGGPFIALNCGAIPTDLLESEVFGHLKGAFTGAIQDKPGAAAAADGGTLFLDEVCELDLNLQTKLLRFLQTSQIQPVGAARPRKVDVRIVCATNRDPLAEVRAGRFREDLYYRLHVVPIHMPPLRTRGADVVGIAATMLRRYAAEEGKRFEGLSLEVIELFQRLPWPGNVRQLLNVLRNVVVLHDGPQVTLEMLPLELHHHAELARPDGDAPPPASDDIAAALAPLMGRTLAEIERLVIEAALARHDGSVPRTARALDVAPSTLYRKLDGWNRRDGG
ncbi:sigma-54-dependent transcriptional regulator [Rhodobaculum claviforme]|uniref:Nif-specific regulatory protein n=1 Tax=Rhodobaculum claviforme TaxID=1549854 RepID=A0A934TL04_9RHOB|nr:sigma-54 dependent transcriptional regulator [Rhodobaculum claviforme]MBK5926958.1 sigma-54-dependent Fis family transcriptional regulator [Rhodobaculum claviforme]